MAEQNVKNDATAKKGGNKNTEIMIGAAAIKLERSLADFTAAVKVAETLNKTVSEHVLQISNLEDQIGNLQQDLKNKKAQNLIEVKLDYEGNKLKFVNEFLTENNKTAVDSAEYQALQAKLASATTNLESQISSEVNKAKAVLESKHADNLKIKDLEYKTASATNLAQIEQLNSKVEFLEKQVAMWMKALDDERTAQTERAKASAIGTLNVGNKS